MFCSFIISTLNAQKIYYRDHLTFDHPRAIDQIGLIIQMVTEWKLFIVFVNKNN